MPSSEARRQKKHQKKKTKRQQKVALLHRRDSTDPGVVLHGVENWPIYDVRVPSSLWEVGMGNVIIARWSPDRRLVVGIYLVDAYYHGIKNAFWKTYSLLGYSGLIHKAIHERKDEMRQEKPEYVAKLLRDVEEWAMNNTFKTPHADYRHARKLLAGIDPDLCQEIFTFGKDGKPVLIIGPNDNIDDYFPNGMELAEQDDDIEDLDVDDLDDDVIDVEAGRYRIS